MAREIESINRFDHQSHKYGLKKQHTVIRCDDGAVYEFIKGADEPLWRLKQRFKPNGSKSLSRGVLPQAIKQTAKDIFGEGRWQK